MKLSSLIEMSYDSTGRAPDVYNLLDKYAGQIKHKIGHNTYRALQTDLMLGKDAGVEQWINDHIKSGELIDKDIDAPPDDKALPFEEIDALHENEEYCPKCTTRLRESVKKLVAECWKTHKQVGTKKKGGKTVPNCVPKNEEVDEAKRGPKPAKGKRFAKKVKGKGGRTRTVSYGQAGKAKGGGDRIRPGTKKGHAYCARSAKIKKCKNPPCANTLSRKKWKCQGSRSVPE